MNLFGQSLLEGAGDRLLKSLSAPLQNWLVAHPVAQWLVMHPLWLLGLVVMAIALLIGLFGAIGRLTENIWLRLFRVPLWLLAAVFGSGLKLARLLAQTSAQKASEPEPENATQRLCLILARLDELRDEEAALLSEVKGLLGQTTLQSGRENRSYSDETSGETETISDEIRAQMD
ncbi:MAG: hypothetical protein Fur0046_06100 [Cyanobacteria bacterium J069]|nr:MAG: hypothetical protein D6742_13465 [Cyanobacteria bacterium J069]